MLISGFLWVLESYRIDNAIFQDMENLEREDFLTSLCKSFGLLFGKILNYLKIDMIYCRIKHCLCYLCLFALYNIKLVILNSKEIMKYSVESNHFLFLHGFKMSFMFRKFSNFSFEKFWKYLFKSLYEPCDMLII